MELFTARAGLLDFSQSELDSYGEAAISVESSRKLLSKTYEMLGKLLRQKGGDKADE
jgi:hypothetical protein